MEIYKSISSLTKRIGRIKSRNSTIGFVPTMGFLHEGHLSLIRKARKDCDCVAVSIFVNPIQFGPKEDFRKYPGDLKRDLGLCGKFGVDIIFFPTGKTMYKALFSTYVNVEGITDGLCGASRPGHFKGVTTVVNKLFNIIRPDIAYFGQKDAQQAIVIKKMAEDLNMPVRIKVMPIVREKSGLAMSSRNIYLSAEEHKEALLLYKSLKLAGDLYNRGERDSKNIIGKMRRLILGSKHIRIDYISIVDWKSLKEIKKITGKTLVAAAVWIGRTRLIDNVILN